MSAEFDDEFGVGDDLEALLADGPPAPPKKVARKAVVAPKTPADPVTDQVEPDPVTPAEASPPAIDPALLRGLFDEMREQIRAELRAEMGQEKPKGSDLDASAVISATQQTGPVEAKPGEGRTIHFIEDGLTIGGRVFYRGEQFTAPADAAWAQMSGNQQVLTFGKRMFREGPWDGDGFDLSDPALSKSDRERLLELTRKQQSALAQ